MRTTAQAQWIVRRKPGSGPFVGFWHSLCCLIFGHSGFPSWFIFPKGKKSVLAVVALHIWAPFKRVEGVACEMCPSDKKNLKVWMRNWNSFFFFYRSLTTWRTLEQRDQQDLREGHNHSDFCCSLCCDDWSSQLTAEDPKISTPFPQDG